MSQSQKCDLYQILFFSYQSTRQLSLRESFQVQHSVASVQQSLGPVWSGFLLDASTGISGFETSF